MIKELIINPYELEKYLIDIAKLRISVFKEYPYLYDGNIEYEFAYLNKYVENPNTLVYAIFFEEQIIGVTTAIPLIDEIDEIKEPFLNLNLPIEKYYYFGESLILPEYRGKGFGHKFFDIREKYALSNEGIKYTCFCSVERLENHPFKPKNYISKEEFWKKRGYSKNNNLQCKLEWKDINEENESSKTLTFWIKEW